MSLRSLAVYLPMKTAIAPTPPLIALEILVGLLAPFWIFCTPADGSPGPWHPFVPQVRPLTGVV